MWVDEKDKQVARIEAVLFDNFKVGGGLLANLKKGASFTLEQERVNDEIWLPSSADINLSVKVLLVKGINVNQVIKSYNYQKFRPKLKIQKSMKSKIRKQTKFKFSFKRTLDFKFIIVKMNTDFLTLNFELKLCDAQFFPAHLIR